MSMRQPHVKTLFYEVSSDETVRYLNPSPQDIVQETWNGHLEHGALACEMQKHFDSVSEAREEVDAYLRSWEILASLTCGMGRIRFKYARADVVDLAPPDSIHAVVVTPLASEAVLTARLGVVLTTGNYPSPPEDFIASPDVETLWHRYEGYRGGREPLLSMAYFALSYVECTYGCSPPRTGKSQRVRAAQVLRVSVDVLHKLGELTALGDAATARKIQTAAKPRPLTSKETNWVEEAVKRLIHRVGECDYARMHPGIELPIMEMTLPPSMA